MIVSKKVESIVIIFSKKREEMGRCISCKVKFPPSECLMNEIR